MIYRSPFTAAVLDACRSLGKPVGDADVPEIAYGWDGQPSSPGSSFTPYLVVYPQAATVSSGPIASPSADWQLPYVLTSYGATREQCEWLADRARNAIRSLKDTTMAGGDGQYTVIKAGTASIGTVSRQDVTDPPFFAQTDTVVVWVSKELGA